jgi:hypothetical protein
VRPFLVDRVRNSTAQQRTLAKDRCWPGTSVRTQADPGKATGKPSYIDNVAFDGFARAQQWCLTEREPDWRGFPSLCDQSRSSQK